jgi:hypothetical protein
MPDSYEYVGSRPALDGESPSNEADIIFVWYDITAKQYIEIFASEKGSQWGQPVHILKLNIPILTAWLMDSLDDDDDEQEQAQYFE